MSDYFFVEKKFIFRNHLIIDENELHHLKNVLRKEISEIIFVVDGIGNCYEAKILSYTKLNCECEIISIQKNFSEPKNDLTLAVGMLKNSSKFDFIVEKATELGIKKIIPMITKNTITKFAKTERWNKIALASMKQCGRGFLPIVEEAKEIKKIILDSMHYEKKLIPYEFENENKEIKIQNSGIILIGSEGGFTKEEIKFAIENKFETISLGNRRLRTETAAIVSCAKFVE